MRKLLILAAFIFFRQLLPAQDFIAAQKGPGTIPLVSDSGAAVIYTDPKDEWLVQKAATLLQRDIEQVTGLRPVKANTPVAKKRFGIIIGTLDHSALIQQLAASGRLHTQGMSGQWESFILETVDHPLPGMDAALVIAGSDRRGAAYGVFELSRRMGVSPWYWWADVPVKKRKTLFIKTGVYRYASPGVKYRGIFINDEAPAFSGWTKEKFGGVNHNVYEKVFELLLRLKGNYLWPAMWGNAFNDDDPLNPVLADQWGIVMGTSHHEPMLRAQQEWKRYGHGEWNYNTNADTLRAFWRKGIQHMGHHESIVTVGMRGDGDKPMTEGTATALLEKIVADQRSIIADVTHKPAAQTPQLWALYKEVQDYYDKGMRVPDDITLLLCDDNWGNIRRLPAHNAPPRKGGYGIYYHFDYVGGPRNYKWLNTNNIARVWDQMHLAWEYNARQIWIVNVGDLKPMELPISFFLDYAWAPDKIQAEDLPRYTVQWCREQFGEKHAAEIAAVVDAYTQYNARCKPELLGPETFSHTGFVRNGVMTSESRDVTQAYQQLLEKAERLGKDLPASCQDAYFELVLHPVKACANLYALYAAVAENRINASLGLPGVQAAAETARQLFTKDSLISVEYHHIAQGKWNHMMDQTHIGYTWWQQPPVNKLPALIDSSSDTSIARALHVEQHVQYPPPKQYTPKDPHAKGRRFYEYNDCISIEAAHYTNATPQQWKTIPGIGLTGSGLTPFPVTAATQQPGGNSSHVEYQLFLYDSSEIQVQAWFSPTLNIFHQPEGLRYAISFDNEEPQIISINKDDNVLRRWEKWVAENIIIKTSAHTLAAPGRHMLKYWMVDPGVVLQKLVIFKDPLPPSRLGPPETPNDR